MPCQKKVRYQVKSLITLKKYLSLFVLINSEQTGNLINWSSCWETLLDKIVFVGTTFLKTFHVLKNTNFKPVIFKKPKLACMCP